VAEQPAIARPGRREQIKSRLREWIAEAALQPGDRLLPQRELASLLETTEVTTHRVLTELAEAGEVYRVQGRGTFVGPHPAPSEPGGAVTLVLPGKDLDRPRNNPECWPVVQTITRAFMTCTEIRRPFQMYSVTDDDDVETAARHVESAAAVFFHYGQTPRVFIDALIRRGRVPVVCMGAPHPDMPCLTIDHDRAAGARRGIDYLLSRGYRRIGLVASGRSYGNAMLSGYRTALHEAGIEIVSARTERCGESRGAAADAAARLLARADCDAILADSDLRALGVHDHLQSSGIAVPDEMGLMGYDGLDFTRFHPPFLTSVEIPWAELIAAALQDIEHLDGTRTPHKHIEMIGRVAPGRTTANQGDTELSKTASRQG
jgi:DNA-binding LacI/PurR family transcriptional regulator